MLRRLRRVFTIGGTADEVEIGSVDVEREAFVAVAVCPLFRLQFAVHIDGRALLQILRGGFGFASEDVGAIPDRILDHFTRLAVFLAFVGGERETANRESLRRVAEFRVTTEIADDDDAIEG